MKFNIQIASIRLDRRMSPNVVTGRHPTWIHQNNDCDDASTHRNRNIPLEIQWLEKIWIWLPKHQVHCCSSYEWNEVVKLGQFHITTTNNYVSGCVFVSIRNKSPRTIRKIDMNEKKFVYHLIYAMSCDALKYIEIEMRLWIPWWRIRSLYAYAGKERQKCQCLTSANRTKCIYSVHYNDHWGSFICFPRFFPFAAKAIKSF